MKFSLHFYMKRLKYLFTCSMFLFHVKLVMIVIALQRLKEDL